MARGKKQAPEQIVNVLRQIEVAVANGKTTPLACKEAGITEQTYYRWRKEYGGLKVDQAKRLGRRAESGQADPSGQQLESVARRLEAGTVWINQHLNLHPTLPFSGFKESGFGVEFGREGLAAFCNTQIIARK